MNFFGVKAETGFAFRGDYALEVNIEAVFTGTSEDIEGVIGTVRFVGAYAVLAI